MHGSLYRRADLVPCWSQRSSRRQLRLTENIRCRQSWSNRRSSRLSAITGPLDILSCLTFLEATSKAFEMTERRPAGESTYCVCISCIADHDGWSTGHAYLHKQPRTTTSHLSHGPMARQHSRILQRYRGEWPSHYQDNRLRPSEMGSHGNCR